MTRTGRFAAAGLVAATLALAGGTVAEAATGTTSPDASSSASAKPGDNGSWTKDNHGMTSPDASSSASAKPGDNGSWTKDDHGKGEWPKGAPHTGDGASMLSSAGNVATGTTLAAAGIGIGALALRRRRAAQSN